MNTEKIKNIREELEITQEDISRMYKNCIFIMGNK